MHFSSAAESPCSKFDANDSTLPRASSHLTKLQKRLNEHAKLVCDNSSRSLTAFPSNIVTRLASPAAPSYVTLASTVETPDTVSDIDPCTKAIDAMAGPVRGFLPADITLVEQRRSPTHTWIASASTRENCHSGNANGLPVNNGGSFPFHARSSCESTAQTRSPKHSFLVSPFKTRKPSKAITTTTVDR